MNEVDREISASPGIGFDRDLSQRSREDNL